MGLRLGEGLALRVGDIDAARSRVHVRDAKGNRDRLVPLPAVTLSVLRRFRATHRNPELMFPNRQGGLSAAHLARTPLDRGGVQKTLRQVALECGLKKRSPPTVRRRFAESQTFGSCPRLVDHTDNTSMTLCFTRKYSQCWVRLMR